MTAPVIGFHCKISKFVTFYEISGENRVKLLTQKEYVV